MTKQEELKSTLAALPGWNGLNAYDRTKRCCEQLALRGERIPSWTAIRDLIGKGSSGDINRAKDDYRQEHAETLRKMAGTLPGVPEVLSPHVMGLWSEAVMQARREFDQEVAQWAATVERAEAAQAQADLERDDALNLAETLKAQVSGLQEANTALQSTADTERAAREQAERMFEATRTELAEQRDELKAALASSKHELGDAISRLEGAETHALMEIERARSRAAEEIEGLKRKAERAESASTIEKARLQAENNSLRERLGPTTKRLEALTQEVGSLRERAERAETQNTDLIAAVGKRSSGAPSIRRSRLNLKRR